MKTYFDNVPDEKGDQFTEEADQNVQEDKEPTDKPYLTICNMGERKILRFRSDTTRQSNEELSKLFMRIHPFGVIDVDN